jgi:hypothetical protein
MSALLFEIALAVAGALIAIVGQLLPKDWQKRTSLLLGVLLLFGALMSALLDVSTSLLWRQPGVTVSRDYEPGTLIAELNEERAATLTAVVASVPGSSGDSGAATAFSAAPTAAPAKTTGAPASTKAAKPTNTPRPTHTLMPTGTPTPTDAPTNTAEPTSTPVIPTDIPTDTPTVPATSTPTVEPTREERQRKTPIPEPLRLSRKKLTSRLKGVAVTDPNEGTQETIFELGGHPAYNTIISAAWSPDGERILIAYRWARSRQELGITLHIVNADGSGGRDVLALSTAGYYRALGNALWLPDGKTIALHLLDGADNGVWLINADGSGLKRLDSSVPGEWPRFLSTDEEWLITVAGDGGLYAVALDESRRLPMSSWGQEGIYDQRYYPWRERRGTRCNVQEDSWWKCK